MRRAPFLTAIAGGAALLVALTTGVAAFDRGQSHAPPAPPTAFREIAQKNEDAAILAAANMKARAREHSAAADRRLDQQSAP